MLAAVRALRTGPCIVQLAVRTADARCLLETYVIREIKHLILDYLLTSRDINSGNFGSPIEFDLQ